MKRIAIAVLSLLFALPTFAQTGDIHALMNELNGAFGERGQLHDEFNAQNHEKDSVASQGHDVVLDQESYDKALAKHNAWQKAAMESPARAEHDATAARLTQLVAAQTNKVNDLTGRMNNYKQREAQHNANRCYYPANNPSACNWYENERQQLANEANSLTNEGAQLNQQAAAYNAQKAELDTQRQSFVAENDRINADAKMVDQQGVNLNAAILAYKTRLAAFNEAIKRHNQAWAENEAKIARILIDLKAIGVQTGNCQNALKDTRDGALENIHAVCGQMFDGNK